MPPSLFQAKSLNMDFGSEVTCQDEANFIINQIPYHKVQSHYYGGGDVDPALTAEKIWIFVCPMRTILVSVSSGTAFLKPG